MRMAAGVNVDVHGQTDVGKARKENQDQFLIAALRKTIEIGQTSLPPSHRRVPGSDAHALLLLVADGVGGVPGGDEASAVVLDTVAEYVARSMRCFYKLDEFAQDDLLGELARSVREGHASIMQRAAGEPGQPAMATTLTMAHVLWPRAYVVQIGDSRCYHVRGAIATQVTSDHTMVQELLRRGALSEEDARRSPFRHVLSRAVGGEAKEIEPEISWLVLEPGDALLLCSDGLTNHVADTAIAERLNEPGSARDACGTLVQAALDDGGSDNVTVVVARFEEGGE